MKKLKLAVHEHPLYPVGGNQIRGNKGLLLICDGCYGEAHLDSGYSCSQCRLSYLHKKCAESPPEINHPSHPDHSLQLLVGSECSGKRCHICGVDLEALCYHCSICDFTLDTGCALDPPLPIIEQPKAHEHTLTLMSSTEVTDRTCHVCDKKRRYNKNFYSCSVCDLFFHIECASLSPEINHSSHPRHLLQLIKGGSSKNHSNCCTLCGKDVEPHQNCYHCSICNFTVDARCAKNPPPLAFVSPKTHKHQLTCLPRRDHFTCNACGKQGDQSPYVCVECNFMVHRSCIDLPRVIWINRHDHRISLTYDLDVDIGNLDLECKVCRQAVDPCYGAYSCLECKNFIVHSRCATKLNIWDGRDLEGEPEEVEDVSPFKVIGDNLIKHFSHEEHALEFIENENVDRETIACRACIKPIGAERFYKCLQLQCDFFLHKACANLPRKIRSVLFDEKLTLVGGASHFQDTFFCSPCGRYSSGFRFQDRTNDYKVDLQCIMTRDTLKREAHPHPLYFFTTEPTKCNSCHEEEHYGFRCVKVDCAFSLCYKCAVLFPETVKHKSDDHTLRLCYQEYGNGKYWCDICEKEVDNYYKQYYTCDDCGTTLHIKCVLGDVLGSISPGSMIRHTWFEFQVVANSGINRKLCCVCHSRCTFSLALKKMHDDLDRYICNSYDCLRRSFLISS